MPERKGRRAVFALASIALLAVTARGDTRLASDAPSEATIREVVRLLTFLSDERERQRVKGQIRETLSNQRFAFCRNQRYELTAEDTAMCFLSEELADVCEAFHHACESVCERSPEACTPAFAPGELPARTGTLRIPPGVVRAARSSFWVCLLFVTVALLVFVGKHVSSWRIPLADDAPPTDPRRKRRGPGPLTPAMLATYRAEPDDLLLADEASERGDHDHAMELALRGAYRALQRAGQIAVRENGTNGDYLEDVRSTPEIHGALVDAVDAVEAVQFGGAPATASGYANVRHAVLRLSSQLVSGTALVLSCLVSSGCDSSDLRQRAENDPLAAPGGTAMLRELVEGRGGRFHHRTRSVVELGDGVGAVIVHPKAQLTSTQWQTLMTWTARGHVLVLAQPTPRVPAAIELGEARQPCESPPRSVTDALLDSEVRLAYRGATLELFGSAWLPLAMCGEHAVVAWRELGAGRVVALGSDEPLTNASLGAADNGLFFLSWLGPARVVHFVDDLTGSGSQSPYVAVANAGLVPVVAQLLLAALILIVARTRTKAPARRRPADAAPRFSEHVVAMGRLFAEAHAADYALATYRRWAVTQLARQLRAHAAATPDELSRAIARKTDRDELEVRALLFGRPEGDEARASLPLDDLHALQTLVSELVPEPP